MKSEILVKIKKLSSRAVIPHKSRVDDAGVDITATSMKETDMYVEYGTDIAVSIPEGHAGFLLPRSSLSNYDLVLANHVGLIDSNYRGEIKFRFKLSKTSPRIYNLGDRIGQLVVLPVPAIIFAEVENLDETDRGNQGYGSSGL
jgi:dUTP pyrophosphatase